MHCYNYLCTNISKYFFLLSIEQATDSTEIFRAQLDSVINSRFSFYKENSIYLSDEEIKLSLTQDTRQGKHIGEKKPFTLEGDDGIFALLLICFVFFTRIYKGGLSFFRENIRIFFSFRKKQSTYYSETTSTDFWFNFVLVFQTVLLAAIVLFDHFLETNESYVPPHSFSTILLFVLALSVFLFVKYLLYKLIGILFNIKDSINIWVRNYMLILEMMGIISFIPVLILVYSQNLHNYLLFFFIVLFIVSRLLLFYRLITFFLEQHVNLLFLIAYLCSVEIIPYIILYQVLIYLYKIDIIHLLWL